MTKTIIVSPIKRFWQLLYKYRHEVNSIYIYGFFSALISLSVPLGIQAIVNLIQSAQISTSWIVVVILVTVGIIVSGFLMIMQQVVSENIQQKIFVHSAFDFAYRIPKFKTESVDKAFIPELVNRFFDTIIVQKGVSKILLDYSIAIIQIILGLILLMFYHPFFISFSLVVIIIMYFIIKYTFPIGLDTSIQESKYKYKLVHWLEDLGRSMKTFKLAGTTSLALEKTDTITAEWIKHRKKHFRIFMKQTIFMIMLKALITAGLLIVGGLLVINQQMNIGQFIAAEIIILMLLISIEKLITGFETFFDVLTSLEKIGEVTDIPLENQGTVVLDNNSAGLSVQIKNMSFIFPENKYKTLEDITLVVESGEKIGIAGYNGSGKSTLLKIIAGLYNEYTGSLSFNDIPMRNLNTDALRGIIGDNLNENTLFEGSIYENIAMGKEETSMAEVIKICDLLDLLPYIQSLPQGIETTILSEGKTLSNSIKLKIILARCIAENPKLILLEDTFSHLEVELRNKITEYFFEKKSSWTVFITTNNPDYLKMLDRIIVLEEGKIIADGTYYELCEKEKEMGRKLFYNTEDEN
ncbi:MAG: ABC transporter ATP-binding protein [Bacteroidia bacterium]|jgi:ABC-type bacteriocin/lantibiotic exporter with double-glycine peptidase domain|nr:ABC transporter ATP-binding protein [Bacteroidota bacterium]MBP7244292.1 ABC transporter ATP-binding protein [Bacteroidia bacterium]